AAAQKNIWKQDRMSHLPVFVFFSLPFEHACLDDPVFEFPEVDFFVAHWVSLDFIAPEPFLDVIEKMLMQPFHVHRVERVLHDLQPIAGDNRRTDVAQYAVAHEQIPAWHQRSRLRSQVSKYQPAQLFDWIGWHANAVFERTVGIFRLLIRLPK